MKCNLRIAVCLCLLLLLATVPTLAEDASKLEARSTEWQELFNAGDLEAVVALYSEDARRMPPNQPAIEGREAILEHLRASREEGVARIHIQVAETHASGEMAWGTGSYEITGPEGEHLDHGKWMNVSRMTDDGWKIVADIWNSDMAPPGSEE